MLAHLRVGTREGDIHQCCLLSNSNIFSSLICSEVSEGGKEKKMSRKHLCSNLFSDGGRWDEGPKGLLWQIHLLTFSGVGDLGFHNKSIGPLVCKFGWRRRGESVWGGGTALTFSSHYLTSCPRGPHLPVAMSGYSFFHYLFIKPPLPSPLSPPTHLPSSP